jgi:hypothetical protein
MKPNLSLLASTLLAGALLAGCSTNPSGNRPITPTGPADVLGANKTYGSLVDIEIRNLQDESLGRIKDLGLDLVNGRIVEVLVVYNETFGMGGKTVAVPPGALLSDPAGRVYRLNMRTDVFKTAPTIDLKKWTDAGRSERVADAYRFFGQEPYFLEEGDAPSKTDSRPKVPLGYVERSSKVLDMPVENFQAQHFGVVWGMTYEFTKGRVLNVIVVSPGNLKTKSIIPATALSFNAKRDTLLLDDSKLEFSDEPRFIFLSPSANGSPVSQEETYKGPRTSVALEQGSSYRDVDRTVRINQDLRDAKIDVRNVEVGTLNGRVTVRGWVGTADDKRRIGEIAVAASHLELVDNQVTVGQPAASAKN